MMTLDEAIEEYRHKSEYFKQTTNVNYGLKLEQFSTWLEELKELREKAECERCVYNCGCIDEIAYKEGYKKAIDDFCNELCKASESARPVGWTARYLIVTIDRALDIAKQLKEGGNNDIKRYSNEQSKNAIRNSVIQG